MEPEIIPIIGAALFSIRSLLLPVLPIRAVELPIPVNYFSNIPVINGTGRYIEEHEHGDGVTESEVICDVDEMHLGQNGQEGSRTMPRPVLAISGLRMTARENGDLPTSLPGI
jgi:hypothetical protein